MTKFAVVLGEEVVKMRTENGRNACGERRLHNSLCDATVAEMKARSGHVYGLPIGSLSLVSDHHVLGFCNHKISSGDGASITLTGEAGLPLLRRSSRLQGRDRGPTSTCSGTNIAERNDCCIPYSKRPFCQLPVCLDIHYFPSKHLVVSYIFVFDLPAKRLQGC